MSERLTSVGRPGSNMSSITLSDVAEEIPYPAGHDLPSFVAMETAAYWSLITLLGSTIDSSRSRTLNRPATAVRSGPTPPPSLSKRWQAEQFDRAEEPAAPVEVAPAAQPALHDGQQLVDRPLLDAACGPPAGPGRSPRRVGRRGSASAPPFLVASAWPMASALIVRNEAANVLPPW